MGHARARAARPFAASGPGDRESPTAHTVAAPAPIPNRASRCRRPRWRAAAGRLAAIQPMLRCAGTLDCPQGQQPAGCQGVPLRTRARASGIFASAGKTRCGIFTPHISSKSTTRRRLGWTELSAESNSRESPSARTLDSPWT